MWQGVVLRVGLDLLTWVVGKEGRGRASIGCVELDVLARSCQGMIARPCIGSSDMAATVVPRRGGLKC